MKATKIKAEFENEAALCAAFIASLPDGWTAYPETAGFDILLVRQSDGAQIGVEAKMTLNAKVLLQALEGMYSQWEADRSGPDWRAALVPAGTAGAELSSIAYKLGITVVECKGANGLEADIERNMRYGISRAGAEREARRTYRAFSPALPAADSWRTDWKDHCPPKRCSVPEYVPDVVAGASGPSKLSEWKIKAIKISILLERRGWVAIADFKHFQIDRKRWLDMGWLQGRDGFRGHYILGKFPIGLRALHPVNYAQVEADYEKWKPADVAPQAQTVLL